MIVGTANARREAAVRLRVRGPGGNEVDVDAIMDTGFTGALVLPVAVVAGLGLARQTVGSAVMADGVEREFDLYAAEVVWGGAPQAVLVTALGSEPLLGMRFLAGHELRIEVMPGGAVEVRPLP